MIEPLGMHGCVDTRFRSKIGGANGELRHHKAGTKFRVPSVVVVGVIEDCVSKRRKHYTLGHCAVIPRLCSVMVGDRSGARPPARYPTRLTCNTSVRVDGAGFAKCRLCTAVEL